MGACLCVCVGRAYRVPSVECRVHLQGAGCMRGAGTDLATALWPPSTSAWLRTESVAVDRPMAGSWGAEPRSHERRTRPQGSSRQRRGSFKRLAHARGAGAGRKRARAPGPRPAVHARGVRGDAAVGFPEAADRGAAPIPMAGGV